MSIDKFGRFKLESSPNVDFSASTTKIYIDNCLKKTTTNIEAQLNSLISYQNQLHEIYKNQTNAVIKNLELQLKEIDTYKNQTTLSIFNLEKDSAAFNLNMKQNVKIVKTLEQKVFDLDVRMKLKRF